HDGRGLPVDHLRRGARHRHARPARDEASGVSCPESIRSWRRPPRERSMREIVRTNDAVLVSAIEALLTSARIPHAVLDENMSVLEGSLGVLPRRIVVKEDYEAAARRLLREAGMGAELRPETAEKSDQKRS